MTHTSSMPSVHAVSRQNSALKKSGPCVFGQAVKTARMVQDSRRATTSCEDQKVDSVRSLMLNGRERSVGMIIQAFGAGKPFVDWTLTENLELKMVCAKMYYDEL